MRECEEEWERRGEERRGGIGVEGRGEERGGEERRGGMGVDEAALSHH